MLTVAPGGERGEVFHWLAFLVVSVCVSLRLPSTHCFSLLSCSVSHQRIWSGIATDEVTFSPRAGWTGEQLQFLPDLAGQVSNFSFER